MRTPSARMFNSNLTVYRRTGTPDGGGNTPLGAWTLIESMPCHAAPISAREAQALGTVEPRITYRVRVGARGSIILPGDMLYFPRSLMRVIVSTKRNTDEANTLFVMDCYDNPA